MPTPECRSSLWAEVLCNTADTISEKISWAVAIFATSTPLWHWTLSETIAAVAGVSGLVLAWLNIYLTLLKIRNAKDALGDD